MGTAGSLLSFAIDHSLCADTYCCTTKQHEEVNFVSVFESEPLIYAAVKCLSTRDFSRVWLASADLYMNEVMMDHMQNSRIATFRCFRKVLYDDAVNARLWFLLHPQDLSTMAITGVYPDKHPMPPLRDWQWREEKMHEFFRQTQRQVMADYREGHDLEKWKYGVIYTSYLC